MVNLPFTEKGAFGEIKIVFSAAAGAPEMDVAIAEPQ